MRSDLHIIFFMSFFVCVSGIPGSGHHDRNPSSFAKNKIHIALATSDPVEGCVTFLLDFCGINPDPEGAYFAASFQGWDPVPMCEMGDVWEISYCGVEPGQHQYKFLNGPDGWEFDGFGDVCTNPADNNNRFVDVTGGCDIEGPWCMSQCVMGSGSGPDDSTPPVLRETPEDITVNCVDDIPEAERLSAEDDCSYECLSEEPEDDLSGIDPCGLGTIARTWRVFDCAGNEGEPHTQLISVFDFEDPIITENVQDITVSCGDPIPDPVPLDAEDACDTELTQTTAPVDDVSGLNSDGTGVMLRTWVVEDCSGRDAEITQTITILGATAFIESAPLCYDSIAYLVTGLFDSYIWEYLDGDSLIDLQVNNDSLQIDTPGIYKLTVVADGCVSEVFDTIFLIPQPNLVTRNSEVCHDTVDGITRVALDSLIFYTDSTDSLVVYDFNDVKLDSLSFDFGGFTENSYPFYVEVYGPDGCNPVKDTIEIGVINCGCPEVTDIGILCAPAIDDTLDLADLIMFNYPGEWILDFSDPQMILLDDQLIVSADAPGGTYTLRYVFDDTLLNENCMNAGMPGNESTMTIIERNPPVTIDDFVACNSDLFTGFPSSVSLDTLIEGDQSGTWRISGYDSITIEAANTISFIGLEPGTITLIFTQDDHILPCPADSAMVSIDIIDCECPPLAVVQDSFVCSDIGTIDLEGFIQAGTGAWTYLGNGPDTNAELASNRYFNVDGILSGSYSFIFDLEPPPLAGQCPESGTSVLHVYNPPAIDILISDTVMCAGANDQNRPYILDLNTLIGPSSSPGTWSSLDFQGDMGNPSSIDFSGTEIQQYVFTYSTTLAQSEGGYCDEDEADFFVNVVSCACPNLPEMDEVAICNDGGTYDLSINDPDIGQGGWTFFDSNGIVIPLTDSVTLNANGLSPGLYALLYSINESALPEGCENSTVSVPVIIQGPPQVDMPGLIEVCDRPGSQIAPGILNFLEISQSTPGFWVPDSDFPGDFSDLENVAFTNLTLTNFEFTFTAIDTSNVCEDVSYILNVTVLDCSCPTIQMTTDLVFCASQGVVALDTFVETSSVDGSVVIEDFSGGEIITSGNVVDLSVLESGFYNVFFFPELVVPPGCDSVGLTTFEIVSPPHPGIPGDTAFCQGEPSILDLFDLLSSEDSGGAWSSLPGPVIPDGMLPIVDINPGTYRFQYTVEGIFPCQDNSSEVILTIHENPEVQVGETGLLTCMDPTILIGTEPTPGNPLEYMWMDQNGDSITGVNNSQITVNTPGEYRLIVHDTLTSCQVEYHVLVESEITQPAFEFSSNNVSCPGENNGIFEVVNAQDVAEEFIIHISGDTSLMTLSTGDALIEGLAMGNYWVYLESAGCYSDTVMTTIIAEGPIDFTIINNILEVGASEDVFITLENDILNPDLVTSVTWTTGENMILCTGSYEDCVSISINIDQNTTIFAQLTDVYGCEIQDSILLIPTLESSIYIPNVIAPLGSFENRHLRVFSNGTITTLKQYVVFDRWGNVVFEAPNGINLNDPGASWWDGTYNGQKLEQGVYILYIEMESPEFSGDIVQMVQDVMLIY